MITILLLAAAVLIAAVPGAGDALQFDVSMVAAQPWRLWTGHLTHFDSQHLFYDALMFGVLGWSLEKAHRWRYAIGLFLIAPVISFAVLWACPSITTYRGLSGIDSAWFAWWLGDRMLGTWRAGAGRWADPAMGLWCGLAALLVSKLTYEWIAVDTLFVDSTMFRPLVEAHVAGVVLGVGACVGVQWSMGPMTGHPRTPSTTTQPNVNTAANPGSNSPIVSYSATRRSTRGVARISPSAS